MYCCLQYGLTRWVGTKPLGSMLRLPTMARHCGGIPQRNEYASQECRPASIVGSARSPSHGVEHVEHLSKRSGPATDGIVES